MHRPVLMTDDFDVQDYKSIFNGIPIFRTTYGNVNWYDKMGGSKNRGFENRDSTVDDLNPFSQESRDLI